jgi:serralysin
MGSIYDDGVWSNVGSAPTGDALVNSLLHGSKWGGAIGTAANVTFSFPTSFGVSGADMFGGTGAFSYSGEPDNGGEALNASQRTAAREALQKWANVSNLHFFEQTDTPDTNGNWWPLNTDNSDVGDIRFAESNSPSTAWAYYPGSGGAKGGDVWLNHTSYNAPAVGNYAYHTFMHELGHALGLEHPHESDDGDTMASAYDANKYTIMSYKDFVGDANDGYGMNYYPTTPMLYDVAAIQALYGTNWNYHSGDNTYSWAAGAKIYECIWDGGGTDTIDAANQTQSVILHLTAGNYCTIGDAIWNEDAWVRDNLVIAFKATIENATGSAYNDELYGNTIGNTLTGGAGNDTLRGSEWADQAIDGGDTMYGGDGMDFMGGHAGNDYMSGDAGADSVIGDAGNDTCYGGAGNDWVVGDYTDGTGGGNDILYGDGGQDTIEGGSGNDYMVGGRNTDLWVLGTLYPADVATDYMHGGSGADTMYGGAGNDFLYGDGDNDELFGQNGNDSLEGGDGNDTLNGGAGADTLFGGFGNDLYLVDDVGDVASEVAGGIDTVEASVSHILQLNIENLTLTGSGDLNGTGNVLENTIIGNDGNNVIDGGAGNDTLNGAAGTDTVSYGLATAAVTVNLQANTASGGAGSDALSNFENVAGSAYADTLSGNTGNNRLEGKAGNDTLAGGASTGSDTLDGGMGADSLSGGDGSDYYIVDNLGDVVTEGFNDAMGGIDTVESSVTFTLGYGLENLTLTGVAAINGTGNGNNNTLLGNGGNNLLTGDAGNDSLVGNLGNDSLSGGTGNDTLAGGVGNDVLTGGDGVDFASYASSSDGVTVSLATGVGGSTVPAAGVGSGTDSLATIENVIGSAFADSLLGDGNANWLEAGDGNDNLSGGLKADTLVGGLGNDTLAGGQGMDSLLGGDGNDLLRGALGTDILTGGAGADHFQFGSTLDGAINIDSITDFSSGLDVIELSATIFTAFAGQVGSTVGLGTHLGYNSTSGLLSYDADGAGGLAATTFAILGTSSHPAGLGNDFLIVA